MRSCKSSSASRRRQRRPIGGRRMTTSREAWQMHWGSLLPRDHPAAAPHHSSDNISRRCGARGQPLRWTRRAEEATTSSGHPFCSRRGASRARQVIRNEVRRREPSSFGVFVFSVAPKSRRVASLGRDKRVSSARVAPISERGDRVDRARASLPRGPSRCFRVRRFHAGVSDA